VRLLLQTVESDLLVTVWRWKTAERTELRGGYILKNKESSIAQDLCSKVYGSRSADQSNSLNAKTDYSTLLQTKERNESKQLGNLHNLSLVQ